MIDRVIASNPNLDTREGSIIYNALAPAAVELANLNIQQSIIYDETFANTATREYLIKRVAERGIKPYAATKALLKGEFNIDVPIGSRFSGDGLNYVTLSQISTGVFEMQCETVGIVGNAYLGRLIPIEYVSGLETASLTELLIPAQDEEETEHLRQRYFDNLNAEAFGGNIKNYQLEVNAIAGVGGVKVYPVWAGGGTVKLEIIASDFSAPTQTLIDTVQEIIDPPPQGTGLGIAPIGHVVTVTGCVSLAVNISTTISYQTGYDWSMIEAAAQQAVDDYFHELAQAWPISTNLIVRISQIETRFLDLVGVIDITGTSLDGVETNLTLTADQIPVRGDLIGN